MYMMKKKNLLILLICLVMIAGIAALSLVIVHRPETLPEGNEDAAGYVYIKAAGQGRWFTLPEEETSIQLRRNDSNGEEIRNIIAFTPDSVYMKESTCENQDCVMQGVVTLENRASRVLKNSILCLPNDVIIELYSAEEMKEMQQEKNQ